MLGLGEEWLFGYLGGIRNAGIAYGESVVEPFFPEDMEHADISVNTEYGRLGIKWKREGREIYAEVTVPGNTTSKIIFPVDTGMTVTESGDSLTNMKGAFAVTHTRNRITIEVGSGTYHFIITEV